MNPEQNEWQERPALTHTCASCGTAAAEHDSPSKLCANCRTHFIRYPIPLWIKGVAVGISLVLVLALTRLPAQISLGISLERGKAAIEQKNYMTAQKNLEEFTLKMPASRDGFAYLMIASFNNQDLETFRKAWERLEGERIEDTELYNELSSITNLSDNYIPSNEFDTLLSHYENDMLQVPDTAYTSFLKGKTNQVFVLMAFATKLSNEGNDNRADSVVQELLKIDGRFMPALELIAGTKRTQDSFDVSLRYCDQMLSINKQYTGALCSKARTLLKLKRDNEALKVAQEAFKLSGMNVYAQTTLALVYHYTNHAKERDEILASALKVDTSAGGYAHYVLDIINGKEQYR